MRSWLAGWGEWKVTFTPARRSNDHLLAILTLPHDPTGIIRAILCRIAELPEPDRTALTQFLLISRLKRLGPSIQPEAKAMPIFYDILDDEVFGPKIREGKEQGFKQGLTEGRLEGRTEEARHITRLLLRVRFGPLSAAVERHLAALSQTELEALVPKILSAKEIAELFF
jgi:hypothetical protein